MFVLVASADSIDLVPYSPYIIPSKNGQYYVKPFGGAEKSVADRTDGVAFKVREEMCDSVIWKVASPHFGGEMFLSDDGTNLICILGDGMVPFKIDDVALTIFENGVIKREYLYSDFISDAKNIETSVSFFYAFDHISYDRIAEAIEFQTCEGDIFSVYIKSESVHLTGRNWFKFWNPSLENGYYHYLAIAVACMLLGIICLLLLRLSWKMSRKWLKL